VSRKSRRLLQQGRSLPQAKGSITATEAIVAHFVTDTQAEAILAELRPWLRERPPIDQFRDQLEATVETIWAIHRVTGHYRVADEAFRELRRSRQRAKTALRAMEESSTAPEMANFVGLLKLDAVSEAVNELHWTLSRIPAAFPGRKDKGPKGPKPRLWYADFVRDLAEIAEGMGIAVTTRGSQASDPHATPFTTFVFAVEKLLPREVRSNSLVACAKQINRTMATSESAHRELIAGIKNLAQRDARDK
jgi:hypothetical protein